MTCMLKRHPKTSLFLETLFPVLSQKSQAILRLVLPIDNQPLVLQIMVATMIWSPKMKMTVTMNWLLYKLTTLVWQCQMYHGNNTIVPDLKFTISGQSEFEDNDNHSEEVKVEVTAHIWLVLRSTCSHVKVCSMYVWMGSQDEHYIEIFFCQFWTSVTVTLKLD